MPINYPIEHLYNHSWMRLQENLFNSSYFSKYREGTTSIKTGWDTC